jgi:hypothetical protein
VTELRGRHLLAGLAAAAVLVFALGLGGCGVSATDQPLREGDPAVGGAGPVLAVRQPPSQKDATDPTDLVTYFLEATAGGSAGANDRMKAFLTDTTSGAWPDPVNVANPTLTVIRVTDGPHRGTVVGNRTPVTLTYQVVGTMGDQGRIDELAPVGTHDLTFWVVPDRDTTNLRIEEIDGWPKGQLLLSDEALSYYYEAQPIYFWDTTNSLLVPDLRYVPLTINPDQRANLKLNWLLNGPSPWLGQVQRLQSGIKPEKDVLSEDSGALQVSLSAEANVGGQDAVRHLMIQLQWSLLDTNSSFSGIDLRIGGQPAGNVPNDFRNYNYSYSYRAGPVRYDITKEGVVVDAAGTIVAWLGKDNTGVQSAAISADASLAAVVRQSGGRYVLQLFHSASQGASDPLVSSFAPLGRPSFVPGPSLNGANPTAQWVLVPSDGRLLAVSTTDGSVTDAAPTLSGVSAAVVSPDGRRVAVIANGELYVASLVIGGDGTLTVGSQGRFILNGLLTAGSVAWTSESWLAVAGTSGAPALWRVTADGVLAQETSPGIRVDDVVSYPQWTGQPSVDGFAVTQVGLYEFRGPNLSFSPAAQTIRAPFFGG